MLPGRLYTGPDEPMYCGMGCFSIEYPHDRYHPGMREPAGQTLHGPGRVLLHQYESDLHYHNEEVHNSMIHHAGLKLLPGFTLLFVNSKDNDSLFHALAILKYGGSRNHDVCRQDIVEYAADHLFADQRYHGENCKALASTVGRTMNVAPVLVSRKVCRHPDALTQLHVLNVIMDFLSETPVSYRKRMYQD